ncbi:MAG: TetR/AcrR family transcriptional regulator [Flavonifractor plautii]
MELARENSFDKVSVRDICQRAGITTGAFYHHFRSKEDLLSRGFSPWTGTWRRPCPATRLTPRPSGFG